MERLILQAIGEIVLVVGVAVAIEALLVRAGVPLLRNVFSRDRRVLLRRFLIGLADVLLACTLTSIIILKDFDRAFMLLLLLPLFKGLALLALSALQLGGILLSEREKTPADVGAGPQRPD